MVTGFVVTPILIRNLGMDNFGLWVLLGSVAGYISLIEAGIGTATVKRVAECRATGDQKRLDEVLGTAFALYLAICGIVLMVTAVLFFYVAPLFHLPAGKVDMARMCLLALGANQAIGFVFAVQSAILFGSGRFDLMTGLGVVVTTVSSIAQAILVLSGYGIAALAGTVIASTIVTGCVSRRIIGKYLPGTSVHLRHAKGKMARELIKFGSRNSIIAVCSAVAFYADTLIIGMFLPIANVAHYAVASKLTNLVRTVATKPIDVLMPVYAHSHALKDTDRQFRLFTESVNLSLVLAVPFVIVLSVFGDRIIQAWAGAGHYASYPILVVLALMLALQLQGHANFAILTATEKNEFLIKVTICSAVLNVVLSVILTRALGAIGPALGSLFTVAVADTLVLPITTCRRLGFSYKRYLSRSIKPLLLPTGVVVAMALVLRIYSTPYGVFGVLLSATLSLGMFWLIWFHYGVEPERKSSYMARIQAALGRSR
jgi:O-antigen/teichoic acid export membrane protein